MFETIGKDIANLGANGDEDNVCEFLRLREQYDAAGSVLIAELEASGDWARTGAVNMAQWLTTRCRLSRDEARRLRALARVVRLFPVTAAAFQAGDLSSAQVRTIGANVPKELETVFAEREADLIPYLIPLTLKHTVRVMKRWKQVTLDEFNLGEPREPATQELRITQVDNDTWRITDTCNNDDGQIINAACWRAMTDDVDGEPVRSHGQRLHDALTDICRHYLSYDRQPVSPRRQPHIAVTMTQAEYEARKGGRYQDGTPVDPTTLHTTLCDTEFSRVVRSGSVILDYGRPVRAVPPTLRRVVIHRDHHCRFPGCDRPPQWCDAHHHQPWYPNGTTTLTNLVLLCSRHHHLLHKPEWHSNLSEDGTLIVTTPDGRKLVSHPPP